MHRSCLLYDVHDKANQVEITETVKVGIDARYKQPYGFGKRNVFIGNKMNSMVNLG